MVIPADLEKSEAEGCRTYPLETLGESWPHGQLPPLLWGAGGGHRDLFLSPFFPGALAFTEGLVCYQIAGLCQKLSCIPASHCVTLDKCPAHSGPNLPVTK